MSEPGKASTSDNRHCRKLIQEMEERLSIRSPISHKVNFKPSAIGGARNYTKHDSVDSGNDSEFSYYDCATNQPVNSTRSSFKPQPLPKPVSTSPSACTSGASDYEKLWEPVEVPSKPQPPPKPHYHIPCSLKLEDETLYEDVLFIINSSTNSTAGKTAMLGYVKQAFTFTENKHNEIYQKVISQESNELYEPVSIPILNANSLLFKTFLKHELRTSKVLPYVWDGKFCQLACDLLSLHRKCRMLSDTNLGFAHYTACVDTHQQHPLSPQAFAIILNAITEEPKLDKKVSNAKQIVFRRVKSNVETIVNMFWEDTRRLIVSFSNFMVDFMLEESDNSKTEVVSKIVEVIKILTNLQSFKGETCHEIIQKSVRNKTSKYICQVTNRAQLQSSNNKVLLSELVRLVDIVNIKYLKVLKKLENVSNSCYAEHLYEALATELTKIVKPTVKAMSRVEKSHIMKFNRMSDSNETFQLYIELKNFFDKGLELYGCFDMNPYFLWFSCGKDECKTCGNSVFQVFFRLLKSVLEDSLKPMQNLFNESKKSQSAIDTFKLLYLVRKFWEDLGHANLDHIGVYITGDICRFAMIYFQSIADRAEKCSGMNHPGIFKVPLEVCVVISNINFILQSIQDLIVDIFIREAHQNLEVQKLITHALKLGKSKTLSLIQSSVNKMAPSIQKLMLEGAESESNVSDIGDRLVFYIEDSLTTFRDELSVNNFKTAESHLWKTVLRLLSELITHLLEGQKPSIFYLNLRAIFEALQGSFKNAGTEMCDFSHQIREVNCLIDEQGLNTQSLIHEYYKERLKMQRRLDESRMVPYGVLSLRCYFDDFQLNIEIIEACNLTPIEANRTCNPFIKIKIIPEDIFSRFKNTKSKVVQNSFYPQFHQNFKFNLTSGQRKKTDAIIAFSIKDKFHLTMNQCCAEAFLSFTEIPSISCDRPSHASSRRKQIDLTLTRLQTDDIDALKALKLKATKGDLVAKEFLAIVRSRLFPVVKEN